MRPVLEKVISMLQDQGATGDVILNKGKSLKLSSQNSKINEYKVSSSQIVGVRAIKDDRVGISYSESMDDESLLFMVEQALNNAKLAEVNPEEKILSGSGDLLDITHYEEAEVSIEEKIENALRLESRVKELEPRAVAVPWNSYVEGESESFYLNTSKKFTAYRDSSYSITSSALLEEKGVKANHYDFDIAHRYRDLKFDKIIDTALEHARLLLKEQKIATGKYDVYFAPDCLQSILSCFGNLYSAQSILDKTNPWANKTDEKVFSSHLTLTDHPHMPDAFRTSLFDDEGVEHRPLVLVEEGMLKNFFHNSYTARKLQTETTGHASRGPTSSLGVGATMLSLNSKTQESKPDRYLEVFRMDGLHSGANRMTGNFSVGIKAYLWEKGERKLAVGNVTLSGNIMDMMLRAVAISKTQMSSPDKSFFTVPLIFPGLSVAGI